MMEWAKALGIISATFVSEDLTCLSTGLLIQSGQVHWLFGVGACVVGIFIGDLGLFYLGKALRYGVFSLPSLSKRIPGGFERMGKRFDREGWKLVVLARFVPGLRLPVYVTAGFIGGKARTMVVFALLAGLVWTPSLVFLASWSGPELVAFIEEYIGKGFIALTFAALLLYFCFYNLLQLITNEGRRGLAIRLRKLISIEFWPSWLFYSPLFPGWLYWSIRYLGFHTITASNPGMEESGVLGESKSEILSCLPKQWTLDWLYIPINDSAEYRLGFLEGEALDKKKKGWSYPLVLKPDQAQRGRGVKLVHNSQEAKEYLAQTPQAILAQVYDPGPLEAGIFYYRMPDQKVGHIFSITDKVFPVIHGDGKSTLEELIWAHPRYRMQADTFIQRFLQKPGKLLDRILTKGEAFALGMAGNHVQGTMFKDGSHLYSEALRDRIEVIAKAYKGFYFGRFDIRYKKVDDLKKGKGFQIVELNGATSESTNIYDPSFSIVQVYQILYRQWDLLFQIAYQNRKAGAPLVSSYDLVRNIFRYKKMQKASVISD